MKSEDIERYIKVLKIDPNAKYMLIVSKESGLHGKDLAMLKLSRGFLDEILLVDGNPNEVIRQINITKKENE